MNLNDNLNNNKWLSYTIATCSAVLLYYALANLQIVGQVFSYIWTVLSPLIAGIIIAYLMDPFVKLFERRVFYRLRKESRHKVSVIATMISVLVVLIALLCLLVPSVAASMVHLVSNFSRYVRALEIQVSNMSANSDSSLVDMSSISDTINSLLDSLVDLVRNGDVIRQTSAVGSSAASIGIGFILAVYFQLDRDKLLLMVKAVLKKFLKEGTYIPLARFAERCNEILLRYLSCSLIEAAVVGIANAIFMLIMGMPYIAMISIVVGLFNLAPTFGPILGCVIGTFILVLIKPFYAIVFFIFTLILQTIDGYIIKPKLFGDTLGVSSLLILIAIVVAGRIFGVVGILLAIPAAAILDYASREFLGMMPQSKEEHRRSRDSKSKDTEEE